jgi:cell division septal protein FtsQ
MSGKFNKRFRRLTITLTFLVATSSLAYLLGWSSILMVKEVKIEGSSETSLLIGTLNKQSIAPTVGQRLARVNVRSIERALSELDWLENADVSRNWISSNISIKVSERVAIARALTNQNSIVNFDSAGFYLLLPQQIKRKTRPHFPLFQVLTTLNRTSLMWPCCCKKSQQI